MNEDRAAPHYPVAVRQLEIPPCIAPLSASAKAHRVIVKHLASGRRVNKHCAVVGNRKLKKHLRAVFRDLG